jgi:hypothetical protein
VAESRIVDEHVEPPEGIERNLDSGLCGNRIDDIQRHGANLFAMLLEQLSQLPRIASRRNHTVTRAQRSLHDIAAQATTTSSNQPDFRHVSS